VGQIYNIPSTSEISNLQLCSKLLDAFNLPNKTSQDFYNAVQHTQDRPFNDRRYAVDGTKLKGLGWTQKMEFEEGLKVTVGWYCAYGESWWGDVEGLFTAFPEVMREPGQREGLSPISERGERAERLGSIDAGVIGKGEDEKKVLGDKSNGAISTDGNAGEKNGVKV
jgi:hypothetical protein